MIKGHAQMDILYRTSKRRLFKHIEVMSERYTNDIQMMSLNDVVGALKVVFSHCPRPLMDIYKLCRFNVQTLKGYLYDI